MRLSIAIAFFGIGIAIFYLQKEDPKIQINKSAVAKQVDKPSLRQVIEGRGAHEYLMTHDPNTNTIPKERLLPAKEYTQLLLSQESAIPNVNWEERGPNNVSGRTRAILIDKADPSGNTILTGGVGGGLWRSTDGGNTWSPLDDFYQNLAIGSLVQDPNNFNIIYFGTGEGYGNFDSIRGLGIWKSTDGGLTFTQLAFTNNNANFYFVNSLVAVDDGGTTILLAANSGSGGVQRSADGGATWAQVVAGNGVDLTLAANGDVYAGIDNNGIHKSTTKGASWTQVYTNAGSEGRVELAAAPSNSNVVYALIEFIGNGGVPTIRKTQNAGISWDLVNNPVWEDQACGSPNPDWTRSQDWYDLIAAVDPNNENRVFVGGVDLFATSDGGLTWIQISGWASSCGRQFVHADQHELVFAGGGSDVLWSGNDGGVFKTTNATQPIPTFVFKGTGYNITQFYAGDLHPDEGVDYFLAGSQDNGTQKFTDPGLNNTTAASGGDGGFCHIEQTDGQVQITSFTRNNYRVSIDGGLTFTSGPGNSTGLFINPTDYDDESQILYGASGNGNFFRWNNPSAPGASFDIVNVNEIGGTATHVQTSPNVSNRVYFGTSSSIVRVDDADIGAVNTGTVIFTGTGTVSSIAIEVGNEDHMLVTFSNYGVNSIYESTNANTGSPTFTSIEGNLPDMPIRWAVFNPNNSDMALVATELGVWSTDDIDGGTTDWAPTNANLANTRVDMIKFRQSDKTMIAATHGRGLFTTEAFNNQLFFTKTAVNIGNARDTIDYEIKIFNNKLTGITNVVVTDVLDAGLEFVAGSLTCGSFASNTITINQASMAPGEMLTCTFRAIADKDNFATVTFEDDMESGSGNWTATNGQGAAVWSVTNTMSNSPTQSWFAPNAGNEDNTEFLTLDPMVLSANSILSFWHKYDTEANWDGGFVEISTNGGGSWSDLGSFMIENEYNGALGSGSNADVAGKGAFTGNSGGFIRTRVDLSSFGTQSVMIRFVFGEDNNTSSVGWWVDDVKLWAGHIIPNIATLTSTEGDMLADTTRTVIFACEIMCFSCDDGEQNGAETGIDCGGGTCTPCDCTEVDDDITYDNVTIPDATLDRVNVSITTNDADVLTTTNVRLIAGDHIDVNGTLDVPVGALFELDTDDCTEIPPARSTVKKEKQ